MLVLLQKRLRNKKKALRGIEEIQTKAESGERPAERARGAGVGGGGREGVHGVSCASGVRVSMLGVGSSMQAAESCIATAASECLVDRR